MTTYIRPGFLVTHVANPIVSRLGRQAALIVRGRRSGPGSHGADGRAARVRGPPVPRVGETRDALSGRNLRAAGRGRFRMHGTSRAFRATEIRGTEHDQVVDAYRRKLGHSVDRYFRDDPRSQPLTRCSAWILWDADLAFWICPLRRHRPSSRSEPALLAA